MDLPLSLFESLCIPGSLDAAPLASLDWDKIGFSTTVTPFMGGSAAGGDGRFEPHGIVRTGVLRMPSQACALNYGQAIFEGLKARRGEASMARSAFSDPTPTRDGWPKAQRVSCSPSLPKSCSSTR